MFESEFCSSENCSNAHYGCFVPKARCTAIEIQRTFKESRMKRQKNKTKQTNTPNKQKHQQNKTKLGIINIWF